MDDLVKHLRNAGRAFVDNEYNLHARAADRIEQLEAALRDKDNIAYIIDGHGITHECFTIVYRAALGEKKDG
jgi:hypothetical protein